MSDEIRNDESSTDEVINDIVEETLEEQDAKTSVKAKGNAKDETPVSEPESIASVDKAADETPDNSAKTKGSIMPKTKAGMINATVDHMGKMKKNDVEKVLAQMMHGDDAKDMEEYMDKAHFEPEGDVIAEKSEDAVDTAKAELDSLVKTKQLFPKSSKKNCSYL